MIAIREEIRRVEAGEWTPEDSPLRGAPHTAASVVVGDRGARLLRRGGACSRPGPTRTSTGRRSAAIDQAYGDRNLVCACPPPEAFA